MGTEIVFVLILPIAALCVTCAIAIWSRVAKMEWSGKGGPFKVYVPLVAGFAFSMVGLTILTYMQCYAEFTSLIQRGYYSESERPLFLPRRVVGQALLNLVFVLPAIAFVVVPVTACLIRQGRFTAKEIGLSAILGWITLSVLGWVIGPRYPFPSVLVSSAVPVLLYGLAIPIAAFWLLPSKSQG